MPIVPSRARRAHTLVRQLASERAADRDSAVAQLTLLGSRAVQPLLASLEGAPAPARIASLDVLERVDDRRALPAILTLTADPNRRVAARAIDLAGGRPDPRSSSALAAILAGGTPSRQRAAAVALGRLHGAGLVEALGPLLDALVDEGADGGLRLAVLDVILRIEPPLPRSTLRLLQRRLSSATDSAVAARAADLDRARRPTRASSDVVERLRRGEIDEAEAREVTAALTATREPPLGRLCEALDAAENARAIRALAGVLADVGGPPAIPVLSRALARVAEPSVKEDDPGDALEARAALHTALAALDSRVALHDLRDLIAVRPPRVMPQILEAAARVGDASLVPALARAASEEPGLLEPCTTTYAAIARRVRLRRSSAALRRVRPEHREALDAFLAALKQGRR